MGTIFLNTKLKNKTKTRKPNQNQNIENKEWRLWSFGLLPILKGVVFSNRNKSKTKPYFLRSLLF